MVRVDLATLGAFLRDRRERLSPLACGIRTVGRRRTPGLRRDEVAERAGISTGWYLELERGRLPNVTRRLLDAVGSALDLSRAERAYASRLAGYPEAADGPAAGEGDLLDRYVRGDRNIAAIVHELDSTIVSSNPIGDVLYRYPVGARGRRNTYTRIFADHRDATEFFGDRAETNFEKIAALVRFLHAVDPIAIGPLAAELETLPLYRTYRRSMSVLHPLSFDPDPVRLCDGSWVLARSLEAIPLRDERRLYLFEFDEADGERLNAIADRERGTSERPTAIAT